MAQVVWTLQALDDIDAIAAFIARDSTVHASLWVDRAFNAVERLKDYPMSGRVVPELARDEIREILLGNYRLIYRVLDPELAEIITVHHGARLLSLEDSAGNGPEDV